MCPDVVLLSAHYDGELPDSWKSRLEKHLKGCPSCQTILKTFRKQSNLLKEIPDTNEISKKERRWELFWHYLGMRRLGRTRERGRISLPFPAAAAAAVVFFLVAALNFLPRPMEVVLSETPVEVSLTMSPQELTVLLSIIEGVEFKEQWYSEAVLPVNFPLTRFGEPQVLLLNDSEVEP